MKAMKLICWWTHVTEAALCMVYACLPGIISSLDVVGQLCLLRKDKEKTFYISAAKVYSHEMVASSFPEISECWIAMFLGRG